MSLNQQSRKKTIAVIGIGKLGLCLALQLEKTGYNVIGIDVSATYCHKINTKTLISPEPEVNELLQQAKNFYATTELSVINGISKNPNDKTDYLEEGQKKEQRGNVFEEPDVLFIAVATPTAPDGYDHAQLQQVITQLRHLNKIQHHRKFIYVVCTTMPGYCDELAAYIEPHGYTLSYTPEFIAQGSIIRNQRYPDQLLVGEADTESGEVYLGIMDRIVESTPAVCRMSRLSAEITKLATNCFITSKIAFANAIGDLATKAGAQPEKILSAIGADQRIGSRCLQYGFGFGGPCFPRDNRALRFFAEDQWRMTLHLSAATDQSNADHLEFMFRQHLAGLGGMVTKEYQGGFVFESVTYKPGTVMLDESQQLLLAVKLARSGKTVLIRERKEVIEQVQAQFGDLFQYQVK